MKAFRVQGTFLMGSKTSTFSVETAAADAEAAREKVLSTIGSRHSVNRRQVKVTAVNELAPDQVTDPAVEHALTLAKK